MADIEVQDQVVLQLPNWRPTLTNKAHIQHRWNWQVANALTVIVVMEFVFICHIIDFTARSKINAELEKEHVRGRFESLALGFESLALGFESLYTCMCFHYWPTFCGLGRERRAIQNAGQTTTQGIWESSFLYVNHATVWIILWPLTSKLWKLSRGISPGTKTKFLRKLGFSVFYECRRQVIAFSSTWDIFHSYSST